MKNKDEIASAFDHILCNNVVELMNDFNYGFELENGQEYYLDEDDNEIWYDIYQYFIVSDNGASIIKRYTDEILWYSEKLDMYIWGRYSLWHSMDWRLDGYSIITVKGVRPFLGGVR